jgi:hypothetical protein
MMSSGKYWKTISKKYLIMLTQGYESYTKYYRILSHNRKLGRKRISERTEESNKTWTVYMSYVGALTIHIAIGGVQ